MSGSDAARVIALEERVRKAEDEIDAMVGELARLQREVAALADKPAKAEKRAG